jgi:hypothetical protein
MHKLIRFSLVLTFAAILGACNFSLTGNTKQPVPVGATSTPSAPATAAKIALTPTTAFAGSPPGEPSNITVSWLTGPETPAATKDGYAVAGDDFLHNLFERPIDQNHAYRPDLDILSATLSMDSRWYFVTILVDGLQAGQAALNAPYGVELDVDVNGRGDFVVWARPPFPKTWARENMTVYGSSKDTVGGPHPLLSDAPWKGDTYDKILFDGQKSSQLNAAWVRISPSDPKSLQIAFSPDIINKPIRFLWSVWADDGIKDPSRFDYNDQFTKQQAGSPYKWDSNYYPTKSINSVDNTCRSAYGFTAHGNLPGECQLPPTPGPQATQGPTLTRTLAPPG